MYHLCKPVDDNEDRIVARVLSNGRHKQTCPSRYWCKVADDDEDQIINGALSNL